MSANFNGTYQGIVVNNNDPTGAGRVTLRIPQILGSAESAWAKPSVSTSTVPDAGMLVYVTFEGGDIAYPIYNAKTASGGGGDDGYGPTPKAPIDLALTSTKYAGPEGVTTALVTATWVAPTENMDGTVPVDLGGFEASYSYDNAEWSGATVTMDPKVVFDGLGTGRQVYVRVTSVSTRQQRSAYVQLDVTTPGSPAAPPPGSMLDNIKNSADEAKTTADGAQSATEAVDAKFTQAVSDLDAAIAQAKNDANTYTDNAVLTSANGKNKNSYSTTAGAPATDGRTVGDLHFVVTSKAPYAAIEQWRFNGNAWVNMPLSDAVIANLDAAKITSGFIDAARIQAGSLTIQKVDQLQTMLDGKETAGAAASALTAAQNYADTNYGATKSTVNNWTFTGKTTINGGMIQADTIDGQIIKANTIGVKQLLVGDTSNMAHVDPTNPGTVTQSGMTDVAITGSDGKLWSARNPDNGGTGSQYFMMRSMAGPVPVKAGDRIRATMNAYVHTGSAAASAAIWWYKADGSYIASASASLGTITTDATKTYSAEIVIPATIDGAAQYVVGITSTAFATSYPRVKNVRFYRMTAGELLVDGAIDGKTITGALIRTAGNGPRLELGPGQGTNELRIYPQATQATYGRLLAPSDPTNPINYIELAGPTDTRYPTGTGGRIRIGPSHVSILGYLDNGLSLDMGSVSISSGYNSINDGQMELLIESGVATFYNYDTLRKTLAVNRSGAVTIDGTLSVTGSIENWVNLGNTENLNNLVKTGMYSQYGNANTSTARNYPVALAGLLEVFAFGNGMIYQRYSTYDAKQIYYRTRYNNSWYPWRSLTLSDVGATFIASGTGTISVAAGAYVTTTVNFPSGLFTAVPVMTVTPQSGRLNPTIASISATGATVGFNNWTTAQSGSVGFHWIAVQS